MTPARLEVTARGAVVVATLHGDVDVATAAEVGEALRVALPGEGEGLVVDLADVRYVDSAGVRMLFVLAKHLDTRRQALGISLPEDSPLQRLMKITSMGEAATLCTDLDECVEAVRRR